MTPEELTDLVHLRRARDLIDRDYAEPLDVPAMAHAALMSPAHFSRKFRSAYGEDKRYSSHVVSMRPLV